MSAPGSASGAPTTIRYVVVRGDTLFSLARRYQISVVDIAAANPGIDVDALEVGQRLNIPAVRRQRYFIWPLERVRVTSEFGSRRGRHEGIDLGAPKKTAIRAAADGVVAFSGKKSGYGRVVIVRHSAEMQTLYAHNHRNKVKVGQRVESGQTIATVGHSGRATGNHLHFETIVSGRPRNPRHYLVN